jgi:hypothetical protein
VRVLVKNIEPCWVKYGVIVELPDDTPLDAVEAAAQERCWEGEYEVEWGPEVIDQINGLDQEFEVGDVVDE